MRSDMVLVMGQEKGRAYTEKEIQGAISQKTAGTRVEEIAKGLGRTVRSLEVTMSNYERGLWNSREGGYRKNKGVLLPPGAEVTVTKRPSVFFGHKGKVESVGENSSIRYVTIEGQKKPFPYLVSDLQRTGA